MMATEETDSQRNKRKEVLLNNSFQKMQTLVSQRKSMKALTKEKEGWEIRKNKSKSIRERYRKIRKSQVKVWLLDQNRLKRKSEFANFKLNKN